MLSGHKKSLEAKRAVAEQKLLKGILDDDAFTRIRNEVNQEITKIELKINDVESERELRSQVLPVQVTWTGPWSMQGRLLPDPTAVSLTLESISVSA